MEETGSQDQNQSACNDALDLAVAVSPSRASVFPNVR
jgi:hypothetical protein